MKMPMQCTCVMMIFLICIVIYGIINVNEQAQAQEEVMRAPALVDVAEVAAENQLQIVAPGY